MTPYVILVPLNLIGVALYWIARQRDDLKRVAIIQPLNTVLSLLIAAISLFTPNAFHGFTIWIMAGLALALIGDINNVNMADDKTVIRGLVIFVFAYLTYAIGLTIYNGFHAQDIIVGAILLVLYIAAMAYLWPGLGEWKLPVLVYGLLLPFLVSRAVSTFFGTTFDIAQSILLTVGTSMLYIGDLEYGIHRFRRPLRFMFGPMLYAGGQLLIALSTAFF